MNDLNKRSLLYGTAVLVLGGLGAAVATRSADADVMTLLSTADVQLRLANGIPAVDKQGRELTARTQMIAAAEQALDNVERMQPGMAVTAEFLGFAQRLRGKFEQAAASYRRAQGCADCEPEQRDILAFNQARMLAEAGHREQALAVFEQNSKAFDVRWKHQRAVEEAALLRQLGRRVDAERRLDGIARDADAQPMASLQAGLEYERLGHADKAEGVLNRISKAVPIADYHLARLKLRHGETDTSMQLLERAAKAVPAEVRRRIQEEPEAWSAVAKDARFLELTAPQTATPGR
ncbi:MAG: hypothetical protein ABIP94_03280 [Planctomycetota bacterium]